MRNRTGTIARTSRETSRKGTKKNWFRTEASSDAAERSSGRGGLRDVEDAVTENGVFLSYLSVRVSEHWAFGLWGSPDLSAPLSLCQSHMIGAF